jgi:hypothetical protein
MNNSCDNLCDLWHRLLGHLQYGGLLLLKDIVARLLDFKVERIGVCKDVHFASMSTLLSS